jgi:hypothetical protein
MHWKKHRAMPRGAHQQSHVSRVPLEAVREGCVKSIGVVFDAIVQHNVKQRVCHTPRRLHRLPVFQSSYITTRPLMSQTWIAQQMRRHQGVRATLNATTCPRCRQQVMRTRIGATLKPMSTAGTFDYHTE